MLGRWALGWAVSARREGVWQAAGRAGRALGAARNGRCRKRARGRAEQAAAGARGARLAGRRRGACAGRAAGGLGARPGRWARGLGARAGLGQCTRCTRPIFDPF